MASYPNETNGGALVRNRRRWGMGWLGIALAGTIVLVAPAAHPRAAAAEVGSDSPTMQPDRAVQQEATAIALRIDGAIHRSSSLLDTLALGDLGVFEHARIALNATGNQWPVSLFSAPQAKGSDFSVAPAGERFLSASDVAEVQRHGVWVSERSLARTLIVAVPSRTGQVLASQIPLSYFVEGLNALPHANGVKRYLLNAAGDALDGANAPTSEERDLCAQLLQEGGGFLSTSDALYSVARVPSTAWAVVVRYPASGAVPLASLDPGILGGPTMVASAPLNGVGFPKGFILFPLGGVALLFGVGLVGWKQRWPGLEEGPIAFGEHALRTVTAPLRDHVLGRPSEPGRGLDAKSLELTAFAAEVPTKLPAALGGEDVEFLRTEQVRNLREIWNHTEERLSGQRSWVREEVRRVHDASTTSIAELASLVNLAEQRLEDSRAAWSDVQASLLARISEARTALSAEEQARLGLANEVKDGLAAIQVQFSSSERRLETDMEAMHARLHSEFSELESALAAAREAIAELATREAASASQFNTAVASAQDVSKALEAKLDQTSERFENELQGVMKRTQKLENLLMSVEESLASYRSDLEASRAKRNQEVDQALEGVQDSLSRQNQSVQQLQEQVTSLVDTTLPSMRHEFEAQRLELTSKVAEAHDRQEHALSVSENALSALRTEVDSRIHAFHETLGQLDKRVDAANKRVLEQADELESTNELLYEQDDKLEALTERLDQQNQELDALKPLLVTTAADHQSLLAVQEAQRELSDRLDAESEQSASLNGRVVDMAARATELAQQLEVLTSEVDHRASALDHRFAVSESKQSDLSNRVDELGRLYQDTQNLPSEVGGLKGRIEGLSLAHTRQQEALSAAVRGLGELQATFEQRQSDAGLKERIDELSHVIQQLAEQGRLLAAALEANVSAATRTEGWVAEQLGLIRTQQSEAVSSLERKLIERDRDNAQLRESLATMKESQEAIANRMHMVVQVLTKLSK